jgi:hypothetical protein
MDKSENISKMEELSRELDLVMEELRSELTEQGSSELETEIKINSIKNDFLIHLYVNGTMKKENETEEDRMEFYVQILKAELNFLKENIK